MKTLYENLKSVFMTSQFLSDKVRDMTDRTGVTAVQKVAELWLIKETIVSVFL
jgi:hypothetical protein